MAAFERSTSIDLRALAGLPPDELAAAINGNVDDIARKFWRALSQRGRPET
jgi:flagellar motor switch protein FliG